MSEIKYLLGVDGGGTQCRARLCTWSGETLGEAVAGPANIRFGLQQSLAAVFDATKQCLAQGGLTADALKQSAACLALAGASQQADLDAARSYQHPFRLMHVTVDAHAACVGAHQGRDGGVIVIGTGSVGWAVRNGRQYRVGGWGFPLSDEGSGAWIGSEAARRVLKAYDGMIEWTPLLRSLFHRFQNSPQVIVQWMTTALPRDFAQLAPLVVEQGRLRDPAAVEIMQRAASRIDGMAARLVEQGTERLALVGGLAAHIEPWLAPSTRAVLVPAAADALSGAVRLARAEAQSAAMV